MKKEDILNKVVKYFNEDEMAASVWIDKYCLRDKFGNPLEKTPDDTHKRLTKELARIEQKYPNPLSEEEIYGLLQDFKYIVLGGSPMFGIGNDNFLTSLSNCFVIGNSEGADSYGSIMKSDEEQVQLMKRRGGVGQDISHIRPKGALVGNSALTSAGIVPLMERYSHSTREVAQYGRRGALMLSLSINHPDVEDFIDAKMTSGKVTGANVSVKITNEFMEAVKNKDYFIQSFPINRKIIFDSGIREQDMEYNKLYRGATGYFKKVNARKIWDKIIHNAWKSAEPGILFWDKIISESPADSYGGDWKTISTNPCGEIPLCAYDSCRLLAINLFSYIDNPFTEYSSVNIKLLEKHIRIAQRLMDDIVDLEIEKLDKIIEKIKTDPEPESVKYVEAHVWEKIKDKAIRGRRTGLGVTAEGDMLAAMGLKYGSPIATDFSENIHKLIAVNSYKSSIEMAKERGAFPDWDIKSEFTNPFIQRILKVLEYDMDITSINDYKLYGRRNISNLTIAPTGTTSMMTQTTSGIEPLFQPFYKRRKKTEDPTKATFTDEQGDMWEEFNVFHHKFIDWFIVSLENGLADFSVWYDGISYEYEDVKDWLSGLKEELLYLIYKESPYYEATSNDVDYIEKVKMQGRVQKWVDHSISVTVNMPSDVKEQTVSDVYMEAWKSGCKGVTVYRDGSRSGVLISSKENKKDSDKFKPVQAFKRPQNVPCDIHIVKSRGDFYAVMVGILDGYPYETFAFKMKDSYKLPERGTLQKRKTGWYDLLSEDKKIIHVENLSSIFEIPDEENITRLVSGWLRSRGDIKYIVDILNKSKGDITTFSKALARVLKKYIRDGELSSEKCPICGSSLVFEEGCLNCKNCGYSKCG